MIALSEGGWISRLCESLTMGLPAQLCAQGFFLADTWMQRCRALLLFAKCATLQQGPCEICSLAQTVMWAPAATLPQHDCFAREWWDFQIP